MTFHIITIFPKLFEPYLKESVIGRGMKKGIVSTKIYDLREFTKDKHQQVDDKAYGGGPGMVLKIEPIVAALNKILRGKDKKKCLVILTKPGGAQFTNKIAQGWSKKYKHIIILAGRYEGFDERIGAVLKDLKVDSKELSIGSYVLTGGELPALVIVDVITRQIPGVLGKDESVEEKRYGIGVKAYTRPEVFKHKGKEYKVPKALLSGNHAEIEKWRLEHKDESN